MRQRPPVLVRAQAYSLTHKRFTISAITRYEILRGLKARNAARQIAQFNLFCTKNNVLPLTNEVIDHASEIYGDLYKRGQLILDADIFIAATAIVNNLELATNDEKHFSQIDGLHLQNWLKT